jgi:predicted DCC family thiol-disulfide oxidoreductase YuxK
MLKKNARSPFQRGHDTMLWDGDCGFCRRCKELAEKLDCADFVYEPYQSFSEAELKTVGLSHRRCERELKIVTKTSRVFGGAFAVNYFLWNQPKLKFLVLLGGAFPLLFLLEILAYKTVADNRKLFSRLLFRRD